MTRRHDVLAKRQNSIGQGELLTLLMASWWYAKVSGRRLVIDWRGMWFARERNGRNVFARFFKNRGEILGVPIEVVGVNHEFDYVDAIPLRFGRWEAVKAVCDGVDCKFDAVVFNNGQSIMGIPPDVADRCAFMRALEPADELIEHCAKYEQQFAGDVPVIGIHFRHGNGEDIGPERRHLWPKNVNIVAGDFRCMCDDVADELCWPHYRTFICTDYAPACRAFQDKCRNPFVFEKWLPPIGQGSVHNYSPRHTPEGHDVGVEGLAEFMVLGQSDAMIYTDSLMTVYTRYAYDFKAVRRIYQSGGCPFDLDLTIQRMRTLRAEAERSEKVA